MNQPMPGLAVTGVLLANIRYLAEQMHPNEDQLTLNPKEAETIYELAGVAAAGYVNQLSEEDCGQELLSALINVCMIWAEVMGLISMEEGHSFAQQAESMGEEIKQSVEVLKAHYESGLN